MIDMCAVHHDAEAVGRCIRCGKAVCGACAVELDRETWCRECLAEIVSVPGCRDPRLRRRKNRLIAVLLSFIPGAGHMYLGAIGKGFALMGILFGAIFLVILYSASTAMYWMTAYLVPTLIVLFLTYAVFDSLAAADAVRRGEEPSATDDAIMQSVWKHIFLNGRFAGYALLVAGVVGLLDMLSRPLGSYLQAVLSVNIPVGGVVIPILLVIIGIYLLRKGRRRN